MSVKPTALTKLLQVMDQILKVLSVCESQNSDTDQLEYQPRHRTLPKPLKPHFSMLCRQAFVVCVVAQVPIYR